MILNYFMDPVDSTGNAVYESTFTCMLIHAEVLITQGEGFQSVKVKGRSKDYDGKKLVPLTKKRF